MEESTEVLLEKVEELYGSWFCRFRWFKTVVGLWARLRLDQANLRAEIAALTSKVESLTAELDRKSAKAAASQNTVSDRMTASAIVDRYKEEYEKADTV